MTICKTLVATAAAAFLAASLPAVAEERVTLSTWTSPKHATSLGHIAYAELTEKEFPDAFDFKYFSGGALLGAKPTLSGLRDGVASMGLLAFTYFPAELPYAQLVADMALLGDNHFVMAAASTEFAMMHCDPCKAEFEKAGIVLLTGISTAPYVLLSSEEITTVEQMKGVKIRTAGSAWDRWATHVGASPVNVPSSEMYDALSHGIVSAAIQPIGALKGHSLIEVTKHLTTLPLGTYHSGSVFAASPAFWKGLSGEQRSQLMSNIPEAMAITESFYYEHDQTVLVEAAGLGLTVHEPSPEFLADMVAFRTADLAEVAEIAKTKHGIADPQPLIAKYLELVTKWTALLEPIGTDTEAYGKLLDQEIYSKIDFASYP
ncbi:MAG: C4-dicarboxylate TRAP transporter substrate-binding protein [Marinosulfonomonas sp.]|nr:C4-dicarboxylate TRAP transporter substrate-binding protein [Marinosulfonomonas sp.]